MVLNKPIGGNVFFNLDDGSEITAVGSEDVYTVEFPNVADGEHEVAVSLTDADGSEASGDVNTTVGVGGNYIVTVGDSITNGVGDNDD